jgi:hypothetical protein
VHEARWVPLLQTLMLLSMLASLHKLTLTDAALSYCDRGQYPGRFLSGSEPRATSPRQVPAVARKMVFAAAVLDVHACFLVQANFDGNCALELRSMAISWTFLAVVRECHPAPCAFQQLLTRSFGCWSP